MGRGDVVGRTVSRSEDPSDRPADGKDFAHDRIQPLRDRRHLGRWRALARHLGRRRERAETSRSANGPSAREARYASGSARVRARIRWWRAILLWRWNERKGASGPPPALK